MEATATGLWDRVVKSAARKGDELQLKLNKAAAKELTIKSLEVSAKGGSKEKLKKVRCGRARGPEDRRQHDLPQGEDEERGEAERGRVVAFCPKVK